MATESDASGVYSIGAVAKMLAVPTQTLRAWEDRYKVIVPARSPGGQRLYSREDVEKLRFVVEQTEIGLQPADAHRLLAERGRQRAAPPGSERAGSDAARPAVLVAERDPFAADFLDYFLHTEGYDVHVVLETGEAEQRLRDDPPDVLVVDLLISGGVGLELCRTVRHRSDIPIVAISVLDSRDDAVDAGVDAFLKKPVDPLQFISTVRDLIGTSAYLGRRIRM
jgi:DNA-binding transcriptional MerR regulator